MTDTPAVPHNDFAIIGTGFGGPATPIPLRQAGVSDVVLLDLASDVAEATTTRALPSM
jgi:cation diffusion facilitator CzcD-associated flavoprotein CzcO